MKRLVVILCLMSVLLAGCAGVSASSNSDLQNQIDELTVRVKLLEDEVLEPNTAYYQKAHISRIDIIEQDIHEIQTGFPYP